MSTEGPLSLVQSGPIVLLRSVVMSTIHKVRALLLLTLYLVAPKVPDAAGEGGVSPLGDCHVGDSAQELRRQASGG